MRPIQNVTKSKGKKSKQYSSNNLVDVECYNCHKKGHFKMSCPRNGKGMKSHFKEEFVDVVVTSNSYESVRVLVVSVLYTEKLGHRLKMHLSYIIKKFFETIELKEGTVVLLVNNKACKVQDMRSIKLKMLQKVRYVLELKRNLLLISMFDYIGLTIRIEQ